MSATVNKIKCISAKKAAAYINHIFYMANCAEDKSLKELRAIKWILDSQCDKSELLEKKLEYYNVQD